MFRMRFLGDWCLSVLIDSSDLRMHIIFIRHYPIRVGLFLNRGEASSVSENMSDDKSIVKIMGFFRYST